MPLADELDSQQAFVAAKRELRDTMRKLERERAKHVDIEHAVRNAAITAFSTFDIPPVPKPAPDLRRKRTPEICVAGAADWQGGKLTPGYDSDVLIERIDRYADKVIEMTEIQRAHHPVREAHLWMLGDIVEGEDIFPGQAHLLDASLFDQIFGAPFTAARNLIDKMLANFDTLKVVCVVGNHGRIGRRGVFHPNSNADRMLYQLLAEWYAAQKQTRVTFDIPKADAGDRGWYAVDVIGDYRTLLVHGDQFRGGNSFAGLPYFSFAKKALNWRDMAQLGELPAFDDIACGHWHVDATVPVGTTTLRVWGSPESYNVWSIEVLARTSRPSQHLMYVHPKQGVTGEYRVWLD